MSRRRGAFGLALGVLGCSVLATGCREPEQPVPQTAAKPVEVASSQAASPRPSALELAKGRELYGRICAVCHGENGEGYKADNAPALNHPNFLGSVSDLLLRDAIANGRTGSTMSAWSKQRGGPLDAADVKAVIAFIRSWYTGEKRVLDESPLGSRGEKPDTARGAKLYAQHCARCHGAHGIEGPNGRIGDPRFLAWATAGFLRLAISEGRSPTPMQGFADELGAQGVDDVIVFLRSLIMVNTPPPPPPPRQQPLALPPLPLNPRGKEPVGFVMHPGTTPLQVVARELAAGKRMALLDARAPSDYLREHIKGAASVPYYDPKPYFAKLPKHTWLVAYCACPHAESQTLAQKLLDAGFPRVTVLDEGIGAWKAKGHPVVSAPPPPRPPRAGTAAGPAKPRGQPPGAPSRDRPLPRPARVQ